MKITIWGINYSPEVTGIAPYNAMLAEFLSRKDHEVSVVTSFAYYPAWKKVSSDRARVYRTDKLDGIPIHRCWAFIPKHPSTLKRILHEASFVFSSFLRVCTLGRSDLCIVISPPLLLGLAAWMACGLKKNGFLFHVQDLQPDAAIGLGMLKHGGFIKLLYRLERFVYKKALRVSGISRGMLNMFRSKGVSSEKRVYFPNGFQPLDKHLLPKRGTFRKRHGIPEDKFVAMYSGNLGMKQGLDILLEAATSLSSEAELLCSSDSTSGAASRIVLLICGDGARRHDLSEAARERKLNNLLFLPLQDSSAYQEMLVDADCCLITQQQGTGAYFFPSKLLAALAYGKPVVTVADEESELVRAAVGPGGLGINIPPNQPQLLADTLKALASDPPRLAKYAEASARFSAEFSAERTLGDFERTLLSLSEENAGRSGELKLEPEGCEGI